MSIHKCLQFVLFLQFITRGQTLLLLLLVKHHLLNNRPRFVVQITQLTVFGLHFLSVNLLVSLKNTVPPVLAFLLCEIELQDFAVLAVSFDAPRRLLNFDRFVPVSFDKSCSALNFDRQLFSIDYYIQHLACSSVGQVNIHSDLVQSLTPVVLLGVATVRRVR